MKTGKFIKRAAAGLLTCAMVLPASACKKSSKTTSMEKYVSGKEILESDPYFDATVSSLKLPIDEAKELDGTFVEHCEYADGVILASYSISYEVPEDVDYEDYDYREYYDEGTALFDEEGNLIREVKADGLYIYDVTSDKDGNIWIISCDFAGEAMSTTALLTVLDPQGNEIKKYYPESAPVSETMTVTPEIGVLSDGRYTITGEGKMVVYDPDGKKICEISDMGRSISGTVVTSDGKDYVLSTSHEAESGYTAKLKEVDLQTGKLGEGIQADKLFFSGMPEVTDEGIFVSSKTGCSRFNIKTGETEEIFNWNDTDVSRSIVSKSDIYPKNENELFAISNCYTMEGNDVYLIRLTRAEKNPHAGKRMIVLGGYGLTSDPALYAFLNEYNHDTSAKARAVVIDYSERESAVTDSDEDMKALYLDILSGSGPDILIDMGGWAAFNNPEIMLDLNTFMDGPDGLNRDDYFDNIFRASEKNGKLYHIPLRVSLMGFEVNTNYIENRTGWTYEEFDETGRSMPDSVSFLEGMDYQILLGFLCYAASDMVDYSTKTVHFETEEMKNILRIAKQYGMAELPKDEGFSGDYAVDGTIYNPVNHTENKFKAELLAVMNTIISGIGIFTYDKYLVPGHTAFLGYPSSEGTGMSIYCDASMGIVATSKYADLAWDLIRSYLKYSYEGSGILFDLPVNRQVFDQECYAEMERNNAVYEKYLRESQGYGFLMEDMNLIHEEDIDDLRELMSHASTTAETDNNISAIIAEEAAGYFAGDRSEDEVLKTIQNRASTVVKEM